MTSADAYLGRLVSATDDDATWTVAEEVVVLEGVDAALRFASAWGASADPDVRAAAFDLLSCVTLDVTTAAPGLILELAARVTSRDGRYLRWSAAHALQQMGCNLWVEAATALPDASYLDALRRLLEAGPSDAPERRRPRTSPRRSRPPPSRAARPGCRVSARVTTIRAGDTERAVTRGRSHGRGRARGRFTVVLTG